MKRSTLALTIVIGLVPLGMGCGIGELCPDGVLESGVQVLGGGIWVGASVVPPWMVDDDGGSIVRIGDVGSSPLEECRVLLGGITLGGGMPGISTSDQTNMPAFSGLEEVQRNITWVNFHPSDVINAFNSLVVLGGGVSIQTPSVRDMAGFNLLESMSFLDGTQFTTGYQSLQRVDGDASVRNGISGLGQLEFVGGDLELSGPADPADLRSLEEVGGSVDLELLEVSTLHLPSLSKIGENLRITRSALMELEETSINRIGGAIYIGGNHALDSAHALEWVRSIPQIDGEGELAEILGGPYLVCDNQGTAGNCEGEDNYEVPE